MEAILSIKHCPCCNLDLTEDKFSPDRRNKDGTNYRCKACAAAAQLTRYYTTPFPKLAIKKYRESLKAWL